MAARLIGIVGYRQFARHVPSDRNGRRCAGGIELYYLAFTRTIKLTCASILLVFVAPT